MTQRLIDAADAIRRAAKTHELFIVAAEAMERIGSLEQAETEAATRLAALRRELLDTKVEVEAAERQADQVAETSQNLLDATEKASDALKAGAEAERQALLQAATMEGEKILAGAEARAIKILDAARAEADKIDADCGAAAQALEDVNRLRGEASAELQNLEERLAAARVAAAKVLQA